MSIWTHHSGHSLPESLFRVNFFVGFSGDIPRNPYPTHDPSKDSDRQLSSIKTEGDVATVIAANVVTDGSLVSIGSRITDIAHFSNDQLAAGAPLVDARAEGLS